MNGSREGLGVDVMEQCPGCPRNVSKMPVLFSHQGPISRVDFILISQEPGLWLRATSSGEEAAQKLRELCLNEPSTSEQSKRANPLSKIIQLFGNFDPQVGRIYWTHALKCVPTVSDRDVNKEWRKAATRCERHFLSELKGLGRSDMNVLAFGKYALEMCLHAFDGQDMDQELSISEFMQNNRLPMTYRLRFNDGMVKNINLFVFTNPSSEVVKIRKSSGKMTVEEIQELEVKRIKDILKGMVP